MAVLKIPVTKGKGYVEIDTDAIPAEVFTEAMKQGLKVLVNRGASKVTAAAIPDESERKAKAMEIAQAQVELINTGKIKFSGGAKSTKASGVVMTEARRLARNLVKDEIKKAGGKVSHYEASEITKAANDILASEDGASIIEMAKANLEERSKAPVKVDVSKIHVSEKLVAKAEAAKAEKKATLSKTQAGKPATRAKGDKAKGKVPQGEATA